MIAAAATVAVAALIAGGLVLLLDGDPAPGDEAGTSIDEPTTTRSGAVAPSDSTVAAPSSTTAGGPPVTTLAPRPIAFGDAPDAFPSSMCRPAGNSKYVATTGSDSNPGTATQPYRTVAKGIASLDRGAALFIRAGDYFNRAPDGTQDGLLRINNVADGSANPWLTVCAFPGERPRLYANDNERGAVFITGTRYVHIEGLELIGSAIGATKSPARGHDSAGVRVGSFGAPRAEAHYVRVWNNLIHGFGAAGIQLDVSNRIDIRGNLIWDNAHWSEFATSGISSFWQSAEPGNDGLPYGIYIVGNLIWGNYMSDSFYNSKSQFGLTDGNCIIIDENAHFTDAGRSRTLIKNNICVANGGPGVALTRSRGVDIINNTFYRNNFTSLPTVVNHGEFMCYSMAKSEKIEGRSVFTVCEDVVYRDNVVVGRPERKTLVANFGTTSVESAGNVWVRTGFTSPSGDVVVPDGTAVVASANESDPPGGDWRTIGDANGRGAPWPLAVQ
jgi:parallel beta-helix repeat protein